MATPDPVGIEPLFLDDGTNDQFHENPDYLSRQLLTYIGNKRALGKHLELAIGQVRDRLGGRQLSSLDVFAGSGFVSRLLKRHSSSLIANDIEAYAAATNQCFLTNREEVDFGELRGVMEGLNRRASDGESVNGFLEELYSPRDDADIQLGERVFYTRDNARRLDFFASELASMPEPIRTLLLGPLLSKASVHANTSGVFKGFYKDKETGLGKFGGYAADALKRILALIELELPVLSNFSADSHVMQVDANDVRNHVGAVDLAYVDPPYNQHPYGSNYFMLNLLTQYERPAEVSKVSGIPVDWNRSGYNVRKQSLPLLTDLIDNLTARFVLLSFNSEGYITTGDIFNVLEQRGQVQEVIVPHPTFRGSRNLRERSVSVNEHLFLLDRS